MRIRIHGKVRATEYRTSIAVILGERSNAARLELCGYADQIQQEGQAVVTLSPVEIMRLVASGAPYDQTARDVYFQNLRARTDELHPMRDPL